MSKDCFVYLILSLLVEPTRPTKRRDLSYT